MLVVFVCTGNTCRSPMAEGFFRDMLRKREIGGVECTSAGLCGCVGEPATDEAVRAARAYGVDISAHRSRPISRYLLEEGDLFVCMTRSHADALAPHVSADKLRVLNVPDPYGRGEEAYAECAADLRGKLLQLLGEDVFLCK